MLSNLSAEYPLDGNRLYITDLSVRGYGTWSLLWAAPGAFAAAAPICGGAAPDWVSAVGNTPVWDFHSADDPTGPVQNSRTIIDGLRRQGNAVIYTGDRHDQPRFLREPDAASLDYGSAQCELEVTPRFWGAGPSTAVRLPGPSSESTVVRD